MLYWKRGGTIKIEMEMEMAKVEYIRVWIVGYGDTHTDQPYVAIPSARAVAMVAVA